MVLISGVFLFCFLYPDPFPWFLITRYIPTTQVPGHSFVYEDTAGRPTQIILDKHTMDP